MTHNDDYHRLPGFLHPFGPQELLDTAKAIGIPLSQQRTLLSSFIKAYDRTDDLYKAGSDLIYAETGGEAREVIDMIELFKEYRMALHIVAEERNEAGWIMPTPEAIVAEGNRVPMTGTQAARSQFIDMLTESGHYFSLEDDGEILVTSEFEGDTYVVVSFDDWGDFGLYYDPDPLCNITLVSNLLTDLPSESEMPPEFFRILHDVNCATPFGRVDYQRDSGSAMLVHELVVWKHVEARPMLSVLLEFGGYAAMADDQLQQALGVGTTTQDAIEAEES